jgi:hypothetical protein
MMESFLNCYEREQKLSVRYCSAPPPVSPAHQEQTGLQSFGVAGGPNRAIYIYIYNVLYGTIYIYIYIFMLYILPYAPENCPRTLGTKVHPVG